MEGIEYFWRFNYDEGIQTGSHRNLSFFSQDVSIIGWLFKAQNRMFILHSCKSTFFLSFLFCKPYIPSMKIRIIFDNSFFLWDIRCHSNLSKNMEKKSFLLHSLSFLQAFDQVISQNVIRGQQIKPTLDISQNEQKAGSAIPFLVGSAQIKTPYDLVCYIGIEGRVLDSIWWPK